MFAADSCLDDSLDDAFGTDQQSPAASPLPGSSHQHVVIDKAEYIASQPEQGCQLSRASIRMDDAVHESTAVHDGNARKSSKPKASAHMPRGRLQQIGRHKDVSNHRPATMQAKMATASHSQPRKPSKLNISLAPTATLGSIAASQSPATHIKSAMPESHPAAAALVADHDSLQASSAVDALPSSKTLSDQSPDKNSSDQRQAMQQSLDHRCRSFLAKLSVGTKEHIVSTGAEAHYHNAHQKQPVVIADSHHLQSRQSSIMAKGQPKSMTMVHENVIPKAHVHDGRNSQSTEAADESVATADDFDDVVVVIDSDVAKYCAASAPSSIPDTVDTIPGSHTGSHNGHHGNASKYVESSSRRFGFPPGYKPIGLHIPPPPAPGSLTAVALATAGQPGLAAHGASSDDDSAGVSHVSDKVLGVSGFRNSLPHTLSLADQSLQNLVCTSGLVPPAAAGADNPGSSITYASHSSFQSAFHQIDNLTSPRAADGIMRGVGCHVEYPKESIISSVVDANRHLVGKPTLR